MIKEAQGTLPFDQYRSLRECIAHVAYSCGRPFGHIAADLEYAPSDLSRLLADNPNDPRHFPAEKLIPLILSCGEKGWEIYEYIGRRLRAQKEDEVLRAARLITQVAPILPELQKAIALLVDSEKLNGGKKK